MKGGIKKKREKNESGNKEKEVTVGGKNYKDVKEKGDGCNSINKNNYLPNDGGYSVMASIGIEKGDAGTKEKEETVGQANIKSNQAEEATLEKQKLKEANNSAQS